MTKHSKTTISILAATALLIASGASLASGDDYRAAPAAGIVPMEQVISEAQKLHPGEVIKSELEHKGDRSVYEIKIRDDKGQVKEFKFDASTGNLLKVKVDD